LRKIMQPHLDTTARSGALLDLGCGTGLVAGCFRDKFDRLVGVDISPKMVA